MIRVLVIDDSALVRQILTRELSKQPDIEVVGGAIDPYVAREKIIALRPDVLTLDIEMPRMDGLAFLEKLMRHYPMPVVVVSSLTAENSPTALRALQLGAVDVIAKPGSSLSTPDVASQLTRAIRLAASAKIRPAVDARAPVPQAGHIDLEAVRDGDQLVAIGASTGGTRAIEQVLTAWPREFPAVVMVQHMPRQFTRAFADRLHATSALEVREARDRDRAVPGVALLAPGGRHLVVERSGGSYRVRLRDTPPVHHQRPSVDVLFHSVASCAGDRACGVLLTGMGADGADGLLAMREAGSFTIAQDEATCVVFGMPKEAIRRGAAARVAPLHAIPGVVLGAVTGRVREPIPARGVPHRP